ncbi:MAG TPA: Gfo/Idh/MocA family oxidoreductase [Candidatus Scybalocola faecavium]|nr:Gfo/Idh/MocA family oxidoreductase [Candidatus Scybalocola faecavium]
MKIGTIGTGDIADKIIENIQKTKHLECGAVYSRSREKGEALAKKRGIPKVYTDLEAMMEDDEIDMIYIASPNSLHYEQALMALEHGKHVLCEKPMTPSYDQTRALFDLAVKKGLFCFEAVTIGHAPNFRLVKEHLKDVGRVRLVLCSYSQYSSRYTLLKEGTVTNVFDPAFCGGALMDINYYNIYEVTALFGRPQTVAYYPNLYENGVDTSGILIMTYPDFVCQCTGAKDTWGVNSVQIQGEDGYIYVEGSTNASGPVRVVTREQEAVYDHQPDGHQWYYELLSLDEIIGAMDMDRCRELMQASLDTAWVLEQARNPRSSKDFCM